LDGHSEALPALSVRAPEDSLLAELLAALLRQLHPDTAVRKVATAESRPYLLVTLDGTDDRALFVFLTLPSELDLAHLVAKGNHSMLLVSSQTGEFTAALDALLGKRYPYVAPEILRRLASGTLNRTGSSSEILSQRELEVLRLVDAGCSNAEIGERLFVSPNTVRSHLQSISAKLGVTGRVRLLARARDRNLLPQTDTQSLSA
jgi:DNA-binding NarL/FixJ family response regulator